MSKKLLTKLLAFTMSAGLVLQPVAAYAVEPSDEDLKVSMATEEDAAEEATETLEEMKLPQKHCQKPN